MGNGNIFDQNELVKVMIPWADIILTGPLSIVCAYGIIKEKSWAFLMGIAVSGIYIFGSVLVIISIFWNSDYSILLIIPAISGFAIGTAYIIFLCKRRVILKASA
jgi:hypothetical protein